MKETFSGLLREPPPDDFYIGWSYIQNVAEQAKQDEGRSVSFADIFCSDIDAKTYRLESQGYRVWFTCEVDGVEYRLAARMPREPAPTAQRCGLRNPRCERPIQCRECTPTSRLQ